ncbi:hypothetical protein CPB97_002631, partial [Podila verticillata]
MHSHIPTEQHTKNQMPSSSSPSASTSSVSTPPVNTPTVQKCQDPSGVEEALQRLSTLTTKTFQTTEYSTKVGGDARGSKAHFNINKDETKVQSSTGQEQFTKEQHPGAQNEEFLSL